MGKTIRDSPANKAKISVQRIQAGVRIEKRLLKILKTLAEYFDITLGDLLEGIVLHAFDGKSVFTSNDVLQHIADLKRMYGLDYDSRVSHRFIEQGSSKTHER